MNIIEAIKSGKLFKRKKWNFWCEVINNHCTEEFYLEDILADDWEIKG